MLDAIREGKIRWLIWIIFGFIIVSFAFWGVENYVTGTGTSDYVAQVGNYRVTQQEFSSAYRTRLDRLRNLFGQNFDPSMMDNAMQRQSVLDEIINRHVLRSAASRSGLKVNDEQLRQAIAGIEAFQEDGKFSKDRYEQLVKNQGYTTVGFEARVREDILLQQMRDSVMETAFVPKFQIEHFIRATEQQREVSTVTFEPKQFLNEVKVDDAAAKSYYDSHQDQFKVPEQVKLEYVTLSTEQFMAEVQAKEEEIKKRYDDRVKQGQYGQPEERQASHILFALKPDATADQKKAAQAKAQEVLKEVRANPEKFAELAKKYSEDSGSAQQGGDLGLFGRGAMVKPFEDAVFSMQPGDVQGPVESEFGFHIIKLTQVKEAKHKSFEQVSGEIANEIKREEASKKFSEVAERFGDMVFEQSDSLKPVVETFKLTLQQSDYIARNGAGANPPLANEKLLDAVFSDEVLKEKRNTQAIEVAPNTLVSARVIDFKPASMRKFEQAKASIVERLRQEEAFKLAKKKGEASLADLKTGKAVQGLAWSTAQLVSRQNPGGLLGAVLTSVFKADTKKLPAFVAAEGPNGYTLVKISKVVEAAAPDDAKRKSTAEQIRQAAAQDELVAMIKSLRAKADVDISKGALEQKAEAQ